MLPECVELSEDIGETLEQAAQSSDGLDLSFMRWLSQLKASYCLESESIEEIPKERTVEQQAHLFAKLRAI